jgi:tRNA dimethylallyltransferase
MQEITLPVILGPTGVGKTDLSIDFALTCKGEVISCDSRQVYIGMDIGTDKAPLHLRQIIKHYLIDVVYPDGEFNAKIWAWEAEKRVGEIYERGNRPIIVCGTGLYLSAFVNGFFPLPKISWEREKEIEKRIREIKKGVGLYNFLKKIDKESAQKIHPNDIYRIKRALQVFFITGEPISYHKKKIVRKETREIIYIGLYRDRDILYQRINRRVDEMIDNGLIQEVEYLLKLGYDENLKAFQTPGYREIIKYLNGEISFKSAVSRIKKNTRNYAKRQLTWFRRLKRVQWFDMSMGNKEVLKGIAGGCLTD